MHNRSSDVNNRESVDQVFDFIDPSDRLPEIQLNNAGIAPAADFF
jgi:short-subunit dehydrogenase involved in D-alanine esterification of teichoic acids